MKLAQRATRLIELDVPAPTVGAKDALVQVNAVSASHNVGALEAEHQEFRAGMKTAKNGVQRFPELISNIHSTTYKQSNYAHY